MKGEFRPKRWRWPKAVSTGRRVLKAASTNRPIEGPVVAHEGAEDAQAETLDVVPGEAVDPVDEVDDGADLGTGGIGEKGVEPEHGVLDLGGGERGEDLAGAGREGPGGSRGARRLRTGGSGGPGLRPSRSSRPRRRDHRRRSGLAAQSPEISAALKAHPTVPEASAPAERPTRVKAPTEPSASTLTISASSNWRTAVLAAVGRPVMEGATILMSPRPERRGASVSGSTMKTRWSGAGRKRKSSRSRLQKPSIWAEVSVKL